MPEYIRRTAIVLLTFLIFPSAWAIEPVDQVMNEGMERIAEGRAVQEHIDDIAEQNEELLRDYRQLTQIIGGLKIYNDLLQRQVDAQEMEISELRQATTEVTLFERQIVPIMFRMIDALEEFVRLDVPFLPEERQARIVNLREMMERVDVSSVEKFRRVLEAYQVESEYGRTIEAYRGRIDIAGNLHEVDFLRVGRIALLYQNSSGIYTGVWDQEARQWRQLVESHYRREIARGLRIARKQAAPDILVLPIPAIKNQSP